MTIATSTDNITYNPLQNITGPTTFNSTTGAGNFAISSNGAPTSVQQYTSAITNARYLRFNVTSNHGDISSGGALGFAEAQFSGTPAAVPWETDALSVLGSTIIFGGAVWVKSRRKNHK